MDIKKYISPPGRFQPVSRNVRANDWGKIYFFLSLAVIEHDFCASEAQPLRFPSPADILKTAGNGEKT
jgi:hypothetical protein